jgi:hypothetical protein
MKPVLCAILLAALIPPGAALTQTVDFRGMPHTALGQAILVPDGPPESGTLLVSGIGTTGLDGVSAQLPESACTYRARWDPLTGPGPGGLLRFRTYGAPFDGGPDGLLGTAGFANPGTGLQIEVDLPAGEFLLNQISVWDGSGPPEFALIPATGVVADVARLPDAFEVESLCTDVVMTAISFIWNTPADVTLPGGPTIPAYRVMIMSEAYYAFFSQVDIELAGISALNLIDAETGLPGGAAGEGPPRVPILAPGFPNPFNPRTTLRYELPVDGPLSLVVHDARGRRLKVLHDGFAAAGPGKAVWDGTDARGRPLPSGVYFVQLRQGGHRVVRKLVLAR